MASEQLYANLARVGKNGNWLKTKNARKRPMAIVGLEGASFFLFSDEI